ncbi:hypothetical protein DFH08DRAFT_857617 [Mycena albidolilacea]|uniref:Uncharacterized protein n=1 Tax=Mycena albidolilacea TaxID=1033008 RepID=A0AAD7ETZ4_9AGAR|nr:hypothetical protein DFH08DRAFT_857617 [Mycena albidolilacea]
MPSLLYLYPTFVQAGITDQETLDCLASWPRFNLVKFLGRHSSMIQLQHRQREN